jgi:uncharacterized protein (DUF1800 family)
MTRLPRVSRSFIRPVCAAALGLLAVVPAMAATDFFSTAPGQGASDGLCDVWQQLHGAWALAPTGDEDNDGCSNLTESIAGTNPFDPTDCTQVGNMASSGGNLVLQFKSQRGKKYQVLESDVPAGGTWTLVPGSTKVSTIDGANDSISIVRPAGTKKFYKLEVLDNDQDTDGVSDWAEHKSGTNPALASSPGNASGGVANDLDTLRSLLSLTAAPLAGYQKGYEADNRGAGVPAPVAARIGLTRSFGTMPLTVSVTTLAGAPDATKSDASPADFSIAGLSGGKITIPASAGTPGNPHAVLVQPVPDAANEVPEHLRVAFAPPAAALSGSLTEATVAVADAAPGVEANRTLFVAYLGRESGVVTNATGLATALVEGDNDGASISLTFSNLTSPQNTAYLRVENDDIINVGLGQVSGRSWNIRAASVKLTDQAMLTALHQGQLYISITTADNPSGEIRGYFNKAVGSTSFTYNTAQHGSPTLGNEAWTAPTGAALERDIWRFLDQCTYGGTQELYNEVLAAVNTAIGNGGTYLDGYEAWLDKQMDAGQTPNPSLMQLVIAADNEEFVLRGNKPLWTGNDPKFAGESYGVTRDSFGFVTSINTVSEGTFNNNHPFHNNRRREMWTLAMQAKAQVRQRMAQALSEILVISEIDTTVQTRHYGAANYWDMLANNAFGKYRTILENVTYSPMMGIYLSHLRNRAQYVSGGVTIFPDENYAREIMQLFSIGLVLRHPDGSLVLDAGGLPIPTYDNDDIAELARVMTGLCHGARHQTASIQRHNGLTFAASSPRVGPAIEIQGGADTAGISFTSFTDAGGEGWYQAGWIYPMKVLGRVGTTVYHDFGVKTLLAGKHGQTVIPAQTLPTGDTTAVRQQTNTMAATDLTLAHNMLAGNPASASYNGHQNTPVNISRWLIQRFTTSNPSAGYLYRVSEAYRSTNGNLGEVLKAILLDYEARSLELADTSISHGRIKEPLVHFMSVMRGLKARSGMPLTTLRDLQHGFSDTDAQTLNGWPNYSKTLTQTEVDKYVPNATRFRFGDYSTVLGQSPLRAPSVFNWFLPDYTVPGPMAEAGLFAPEMQIASETNLVSRINRLWTFTWMNLDGMALQPGVDVDDAIHVASTAAVQAKVGLTNTSNGSFTSGLALTFTSANWNTPQTVHVAAVDDQLREGTHSTVISHSAASTDPAYNAPPLPSVNVNISDNEGAVGSVIVEESDGTTLVGETGTVGALTDTYTVRLGSAPTATVTLTNRGNAQLSLSPATLSFDSANWNTPQTVTVAAANDSFTSETVHLGYIGHAVSSSDPAYASANVPGVVAFVGDNEQSGSNGITVRHTGGDGAASTTVTEGGPSDRFVFALNRAPTGPVTVTLSSNTRVTTAPASIVFTTSNWNQPQAFAVTAVDNGDADGNTTFNLTLTSTGGGYSSTATSSVTVIDNDGGGPGGGIVIAESGGTTSVSEVSPYASTNTDSYTLRLSSQPTANVTVTVFPKRHIAPMANHAKLMGYFASDIPSSTSNMQADRIIFDYGDIISLYNSTFTNSGGTTGSSANNLDDHFNAVVAVVDRFDRMWCGGQLKAQWPNLTVADLSNSTVVNPRKSIVAGVLYGYVTTRGSTETSYVAEVRDRCRIAAYLVSISPQSFTLK